MSEIERKLITQFIETSSYGRVVTDLDETTTLVDVYDISKAEVTFINGNLNSELQDLVSEIAY